MAGPPANGRARGLTHRARRGIPPSPGHDLGGAVRSGPRAGTPMTGTSCAHEILRVHVRARRDWSYRTYRGLTRVIGTRSTCPYSLRPVPGSSFPLSGVIGSSVPPRRRSPAWASTVLSNSSRSKGLAR
jgi:hypothetical protein